MIAFCNATGYTTDPIHNLYTDATGQSHFRDIEVEWVEDRRGSKLSRSWPAGFCTLARARLEKTG